MDPIKLFNRGLRWSALFLVGVAFFLAAPPEARAQVDVTTYQSIYSTNIAASSAVGTASEFYVPQNQPLCLTATVGSTNTTGSNVTFVFWVSPDGTNYATTPIVNWTFATSGTRGVGWTNLGSVFDNVRKLKLAYITNGHNATLWITNIWLNRR